MDILERMDTMSREHAAWLDLCGELRTLGVDINDQDSLARAIRKWGEELHQLRLNDPSHDEKALAEARELYEGQYERGVYPQT